MKKTIPILFAAILAIVLVTSACILLFNCYIQQTVASGVTLAGVPLEGMTREHAAETIMQKTEKLTKKSVSVSYRGVEIAFSPEEIGAKIDWEDAINRCYYQGKHGNLFLRCKEILAAKLFGTTIYPPVAYEEEALTHCLQSLQQKINTPVREPQISADEEYITVVAGEKGTVFDREELIRRMLEVLLSGSEETIALTTTDAEPHAVTAEELAEQFARDPVNAGYETEDGEISIIPDQDGLSFDKQAAQELLDQHKKTTKIPLVAIKASVTYADLDTNILNDTLSSYTTSYASGDAGRNFNVELAAQRLNGVILQPGDTFSFVETVGDGTAERGFHNANVYSEAKVVQEPGGGLCQAASTLYSAVLYANLEIVSRTPHALPVGYIPAGQDVTISQKTDFQFRNNLLFPIRILAVTNGSTVTVTVQGTNTAPGNTVSINNSIAETIPYNRKTVMSEELEAGEQQVIQNGTDGCVVKTYRIVTKNGETVSTDLISTSRYEPIPRVVMEGVERAEQPVAPTEEPAAEEGGEQQ